MTSTRRGAIFYGWVVVATLFLVNVGVQATGNLNYGLFVLPMSTDLGMSRSLMGWAQTGRMLAGGASAIFFGGLVDRIGPRVLIAVTALITGLAVIALGHITQVWQFFGIFMLLGLVGLSAQGSILTTVPVAKWFVRRRGLAMSLATLGLGIGAMVFSPITEWLIGREGWRNAWVVLGITAIVLAVPASLVFLRRQPEDMGLTPDGTRPDATGGHMKGHVVEERSWTLREAMRSRAFWRLVAAFMLMSFGMGACSVHRIPYFVERGFSETLVSWSFALDAGASSTTMLLSGFLVMRVQPRLLAVASAAGFTVATGLMLVATNEAYLFTSTAMFGMSVGVFMLMQTYILADYFGRAHLGAIRGMMLPMTLLVTGIGAPFTGYLYDWQGDYVLAWWLSMASFAAGGLVMVTAFAPRRDVAAPAAAKETSRTG